MIYYSFDWLHYCFNIDNHKMQNDVGFYIYRLIFANHVFSLKNDYDVIIFIYVTTSCFSCLSCSHRVCNPLSYQQKGKPCQYWILYAIIFWVTKITYLLSDEKRKSEQYFQKYFLQYFLLMSIDVFAKIWSS